MKTTLIAFLAAACVAMGANVQEFTFSGGSTTYGSGTTAGDLTLQETMSTGSPESWSAISGSTANIRGGNFFASDYTLSLWFDASTLTESGETILFMYSGRQLGNSFGANVITWNAANNTIKMGVGGFAAGSGSLTWNPASDRTVVSSSSLTLASGLNNITIAVSGQTGSQTATVWLNGVESETLSSYNGNMNGDQDTMDYYVNPDVTYGAVSLTNEKITTAEGIAGLAKSALVPEPTTATLGLLALVGLAARRRRK